MRKVVLYLVSLLFITCSSVQKQQSSAADPIASIPEQLALAQKTFNDTSKYEKIQGSFKGFDPGKAIFNRLNRELYGVNNIVYQFTWQNDLPTLTGNFRAILFDKTRGRRFYCSGSGRSKKFVIRSTPSIQEAIDEKVLDSYLSSDYAYLHSLQGGFSSAEIGEKFTIYEIDLQKPHVIIKNFGSVVVTFPKRDN